MKLTHLPIIALTIALTACGSSEKGEDTQTVTSDSYKGFNYAANLTSNNSFEFLEHVFISSSSSVLAKAAEGRVVEDQVSFLKVQSMLNSVAATITSDTHQARSVNESKSCENGGSIVITGDLDSDLYTGTVKGEMLNCNNGAGKLNGEIIMGITKVNEAYQPRTYTLTFKDLYLTANGQTSELSGEQSFDSTRGVDTTISNILQTMQDGRQLQTEDFTVVDNLLENFYTGTTETGIDIYGKIYIGDYGYVDVYTTDLFQSLSTEIMPYSGSLSLVGNKSTLKVTSDYSFTSILLDEDGNEKYELFAELDNDSRDFEEGIDFTTTQPPLIKLSDLTDEFEYYEGYEIPFDAFLSTDPNGSELSYDWSISSKPAGSTAEVQYDIDAPYFMTVTTDVAGDYTITLKLTNENGQSSTATKTVTVLSYL